MRDRAQVQGTRIWQALYFASNLQPLTAVYNLRCFVCQTDHLIVIKC
jgi:hypothetical protein